jgi:hypothetical protein
MSFFDIYILKGYIHQKTNEGYLVGFIGEALGTLQTNDVYKIGQSIYVTITAVDGKSSRIKVTPTLDPTLELNLLKSYFKVKFTNYQLIYLGTT